MSTKMLVIDDETPVLVVLKALFKSAGYEVVTSTGGEEAVKLIEIGAFDILISDVRMSPIHGLQFLKMAKEKHPNIAAIMISAYESPEAYAEAKRLGAYKFVKKPFDNRELLQTVKKALDNETQPQQSNPTTDANAEATWTSKARGQSK